LEVAVEPSPAAELLGSVALWSELAGAPCGPAGALCGSAGAPDAEPESAEPFWPASVAAPESWEAGVVSCGGVATGVPADPPASAPWLALSVGAALPLSDPPLSAALVALSLPDPPLSAAWVALSLADPPLPAAGAALSLVEAGAADESLAGAVFAVPCESVTELCDDSPAAGAEVCGSAVAVAPWPLDREVPTTPLAAAAAPEPRR
jgi:hypothetical protein